MELAPGIDIYCPNPACDYEKEASKRLAAQWKEQREREEYARLKLKYGNA